MRRRDFITLVGGSALALPLTLRAQQSGQMRRLAYLTTNPESDPETQKWVSAFRKRLEELGWIEGRNLRTEYRFGSGDSSRMPALAKDLVELRPDVIFAATGPAVYATRQQTLSIPIVFVQVPDAVSAGYVTNLAHPEGNITGFTNLEFSIGEKWLQIMSECSSGVRRIGVMFDPGNATWTMYLRTIETAAPSFKFQLTPLPVRDAAEIEATITKFAAEQSGGLIVLPAPVTLAHRSVIIAAAAYRLLPALYPYRFFVAEGGLASFGIDLPSNFRQAASYIDRILRGAKPADLPVQLPTKFELVINLKTAKALGLDVAPSLLARADEVIE
jgi:putative tryptophan/tyrosine transport system substrate-binding protein